ncbi:MAG: NAD-dependent epimerase/dehydratase family protein [Gemmobacter sp.]
MARHALITGTAGFIGFHLAQRMLADGWRVTGVDAMTAYYDVTLKTRRNAILSAIPGFRAVTGRIETPGLIAGLMAEDRPDAVVHLAAQAGVRHSIDAPREYVDANILGTWEVLEAARAHPPAHLLIASTSSAYGANTAMPYAEHHRADHPMSFYAATKKAGEAMAHSYAHLYGVPTTLFRFFTVYGPWGRPDMAYYKFTRAILNGDPIDIYNHGNMRRDFTYVDDLVEGIVRLIGHVPISDGAGASPVAPWRVVNIGNGAPVGLMDFVAAVETATGRTAVKNMLPIQPGDVPATWADTSLFERLAGKLPRTDVGEGVRRFVDWYRDFHDIPQA